MIRYIQLGSIILLIAASLTVLMTFISLGFYAYPSADDFCMVSGVEQHGLLPHLWQHYFEWSGRYSGNAFYAIYPLVFGFFHGYALIALLLIISLFAGCAFFLSRLFRLGLLSPQVLLVSLGSICVYLLGLRHTASSLYWMAGGLSYQTANILMLFTLGLIIELKNRQKARLSITAAYLWLLVVVILGMGSNETNMVSLTAILGLAFFIHLKSGWKIMKPWAGLLVVGLIGFAVVYFAPGNTLRESTFPYRHDWTRSIQGSWNMGTWTLASWMGNPVFIMASLLVPFSAVRLRQVSPKPPAVHRVSLLMLFLITFSVPFVLQFPAWWSMGGWPPPRTVDTIFFVFLLSWLLFLGALSLRFMPDKITKRIVSSSFLFLLLAILFALAIAANSKFKRAQDDLWNRVEFFDDYMMDRHARIYDAIENQQTGLTVPAFNREFPRSIFFNDIRTDARDWRNVCYAEHFGLQGIAQERRVKIDR